MELHAIRPPQLAPLGEAERKVRPPDGKRIGEREAHAGRPVVDVPVQPQAVGHKQVDMMATLQFG